MPYIEATDERVARMSEGFCPECGKKLEPPIKTYSRIRVDGSVFLSSGRCNHFPCRQGDKSTYYRLTEKDGTHRIFGFLAPAFPRNIN